MYLPAPMRCVLACGALAMGACSETPPAAPSDVTLDRLTPAHSFLTAPGNTWTEMAVHPERLPDSHSQGGRVGHAVGVANDAAGRPKLYVFSGLTTDFENYWLNSHVYDLEANTWTTLRGDPILPFGNGAVKIGSKLYLSGGGRFHIGGGDQLDARLFAYDPVGHRFIRKADMPHRTAKGVSGAIDGKLYVLAGELGGPCDTIAEFEITCTNSPTRRLYRYDPMKNSWTTRAWAPHFHVQGAAGVIGEKLYVAGGFNQNRRATANLDVYDPATNAWRSLAPMPEPRAEVAGAVLGGKLYVVGGRCGDGSCATLVYDPVANTWRTRAPLPEPRTELGVGRMTLDGRSYLLAIMGREDGRTLLYTP
jgi:hypothetical protein